MQVWLIALIGWGVAALAIILLVAGGSGEPMEVDHEDYDSTDD